MIDESIQVSDLGKRISKRMNELDISQSELARKTGLSRATINKIIHDTKNPGIMTIIKIIKHLNLTLDELIQIKHFDNTDIHHNLEKIKVTPSLLKYINSISVCKETEDYAEDNNLKLFFEIIHFTSEEILLKDRINDMHIKKFLEAIIDIINYFSMSNKKTLDKKFINWYIDTKL